MGGVRPNTSKNGQIGPSTTIRVARTDGSCPNLTSILREGRETANIQPSLGAIRGIPVGVVGPFVSAASGVSAFRRPKTCTGRDIAPPSALTGNRCSFIREPPATYPTEEYNE